MPTVPYIIGDPYIDADFAALGTPTATVTGTVGTTTGSATTIATVAVAANTTTTIFGTATARRTGGSSGTAGDSAGFLFAFVVKNIAGTVTVLPTILTAASGDQAAWKVTAVASSANVLLRVTGAANNNINWSLSAQQLVVS